MKKLLLAFIILIALVLGLGPYIMGGYAKSEITRHWQMVDKMSGLKLQVSDYKRGWLRSKALMEVTVDVQDKKVPPFNVKINMAISHGPLLRTHQGLRLGYAYTVGELAVAPQWEQLAKPYIGEQALLTIHDVIGFDGKSVTEFKSATLQFKQPLLGVEVNWDGLWGHGSANLDLSEVQAQATFGALRGKAPSPQSGQVVSFESKPMVFSFSESKQPNGDAVAKAAWHWPGLRLQSPAPEENIALTNLRMDSSSSRKNNIIRGDAAFHLEQLRVGNIFTISALNYALAIDNLDAPAVDTLLKMLENTANDNVLEQQVQQLVEKGSGPLFDVVAKMLSRGVIIDIKQLGVTFNGDTATASARVQLPQNVLTLSENEMLMQTQAALNFKIPLKWVHMALTQQIAADLRKQRQRAQSSAHVAARNAEQASAQTPAAPATRFAASPLLGKNDAQINAMAQEAVTKVLQTVQEAGFVLIEGEHLVGAYTYQKGQFTLSGETVPMDQLMMKAMTVFMAVGQQMQQFSAPPANADNTPVPTLRRGITQEPTVNVLQTPTSPMTVAPSEPSAAPTGTKPDTRAADFLEQQEQMMQELEERQRQQLEKLNQQLEQLDMQ